VFGSVIRDLLRLRSHEKFITKCEIAFGLFPKRNLFDFLPYIVLLFHFLPLPLLNSLYNTTLAMAKESSASKKAEIGSTNMKKEKAKWDASDESMLIATLTSEKAKANWANNNPKLTTFVACVKALEGSEKSSGGVPKGLAIVKARWQKVSDHH
jgi:hypothetical protein